MSPVRNALLVLLGEGNEVERIRRQLYYVKEIPGKGYNIVELDQDNLSQETKPTFGAYKLDLSLRDPAKYEVILLDKDSGKLIQQSRKRLTID